MKRKYKKQLHNLKKQFPGLKSEKKDLYFKYFDVAYEDMDFALAEKFIDEVTADQESKHNLKMLYAYVMQNEMELHNFKHFFVLDSPDWFSSDAVVKSLEGIAKVNYIDFYDMGTPTVWWGQFYKTDVIYSTDKKMDTNKVNKLKKVINSDVVTGRLSGRADTFEFPLNSVLITENTDMLNKADGGVLIKLKTISSEFTDFINGEIGSVSLLVHSFNYLNQNNGKIDFR
ncbi:MAG: hypothetical protein Q4A55_03455 [Aerococcus sp.]|nr:hypothetical protein [Aerococcus sp.]